MRKLCRAARLITYSIQNKEVAQTMVITIFRTIIMYIFVVVNLRLMGKRQICELEPSELVVTIIISELAAMPITDNGKPLLTSVVAIFVLVILEIGVSYLAYKHLRFRTALYGRPSTFYAKGELNQREMENQRFNVGDLLEEIRNSGASSLSEVDYVIMETNGNISVIQTPENNPVTPKLLGITPPDSSISYIVIDNGSLIKSNLKRLGRDLKWLYEQLNRKKIKKISNVFYMGADEQGEVVIIEKEKRRFRKRS